MANDKEPKSNGTNKIDIEKLIIAITGLVTAIGLAFGVYIIKQNNFKFIFNFFGNVNEPNKPLPTYPPKDLIQSTESLVDKGFKLYTNGDYKNALESFNKVLERSDLKDYPCVGCLYSYRAYCLEQTGEIQEARASYLEAIRLLESTNDGKGNLEFAKKGLARLTKS